MKSKQILLIFSLLFQAFCIRAQNTAPENWFNLDLEKDGVMGVSTEKAYQELLKGKKSKKTIVVAVIDSGVESDHEDLKDVMWVNEDEIAGNGIDDDNNGYIDDIHGWNFIGGKNGQNVDQETYEVTRLYVEMKGKKLKKKEQAKFKRVKVAYEKEYEELSRNFTFFSIVETSLEAIGEKLGKENFTLEDLNGMTEEDMEGIALQVQLMKSIMEQGATVPEIKAEMKDAGEYVKDRLEYGYNPEFDPRDIVGDDYDNPKDRNYGNNDYEGPGASHGTHVAGIIGAARGNGKGMDGVANNVRIMTIRAVPDGDERDKDVANAIIYAVDNGARIVNMSFGKSFAWDKKTVDKAVKYAQKKGVLLVHAAGNDGNDLDKKDNFPTKKLGESGKKRAKNWIEVGNLSWREGPGAVAGSSNYGKNSVDLFAPGTDIYSTIPDGGYASKSGTSMASPVAAGVAALVWSYYPELSATDLKDILLKSVAKMDQEVYKPGSRSTAPFRELSITGGVINAYNALKMAESRTAKK